MDVSLVGGIPTYPEKYGKNEKNKMFQTTNQFWHVMNVHGLIDVFMEFYAIEPTVITGRLPDHPTWFGLKSPS